MPKYLGLLTRSCLMLGMLITLVAPVLAEDESPTTPEAVWAGFDPSEEPLEIQVMKRWAKHGSTPAGSSVWSSSAVTPTTPNPELVGSFPL
jgi:hypothetical protein